MSAENVTRCVLVPCSDSEHWAVPRNCLAEVLTISSVSPRPPESVSWRGLEVPVLDFGDDGSRPWSNERIGTGLVAVFLGLKGGGCEYWGVALRGTGLELASIAADEVNDVPEAVSDRATGAFKYREVLYQVPDLDKLQKELAVRVPVV